MAVPGGVTMRIADAALEVGTLLRGYVLIARGGSFVEVRDSRLTSESAAIGSAALAVERVRSCASAAPSSSPRAGTTRSP